MVIYQNYSHNAEVSTYSAGNVESLRRLKFVYCFIRAAENTEFQEAQLEAAKDWFTTVISYNVTINEITKKVKEYITSEYGLALVLDLSVNTGQGNVVSTVKAAVENVLSQDDVVDDPSEWGDEEEEMIINEYINARHNLTIFKDAETREEKIDNAGLSKKRDSYNE